MRSEELSPMKVYISVDIEGIVGIEGAEAAQYFDVLRMLNYVT